jgi:hypothetical protein
MLPRLIIAAILVNASYWICAIAVDISNIAGSSTNDILNNVKDGLKLPNAEDFGATTNGWSGIATVILGSATVGIALYVGLSALLPALIAAVVAIVTVFLVLTLRQALIILLVVVAPLAFVAYLLPNTESLFKKWRDLFQTLLVMYPLISLIFGASALASTIVMGSATGTRPEYKIAVQIMGAAIAIIPLAITPLVMKTAGGVLNRFGAMVNNPNKGPIDKLKKGAEGFRGRQEGRRAIRAFNGGPGNFGKYSRAAKRSAVASGVDAEMKRAQSSYVAKEALGDDAFRNRLAGGRTFGPNASAEAVNRAIAGAVSIQAKVEADEVTAASAVIKHLNLDRNQAAMRDLSMGVSTHGLDGNSHAVRAAAMQNVVNGHDVKGVNDLLDASAGMDEKTRGALADSLEHSKEKPTYVGQSAITGIRQHGETDASGRTIVAKNSTQLTVEAIDNNAYSVTAIANGDREELEHVATVAADATLVSPTSRAKLAANATMARDDPRYSGHVGKNATIVDDIAHL